MRREFHVTKVSCDESFANRLYRYQLLYWPTGNQGWKRKPENPVLMKIFETQTETDTYSAKC